MIPTLDTARLTGMADRNAMIAFHEVTEVTVGGYAGGQVVGGAGTGLPDRFPGHDLTWFLFPDSQGKGDVREAAQAMRAAACQNLSRTTAVSCIHPAPEALQ